MNSRFVDRGVKFMELEEALSSSFNVVAPSVNLCVVILWFDLPFMEKFLEELAGLAVHAGYPWLDGELYNVVDDFII